MKKEREKEKNYLPMKMEKSVPKCWHTKFRRRGNTQKKTYNRFKVNY
jgi:hypothetical protein